MQQKFRDCLWIVCVGLLSALALRPFQDSPFIDDWTYAWSVEWLLNHGQLMVLDWSANLNFVQAIWGALFCLPFGFSFVALKVSTFVLAMAALCGLYLLLREINVPRRESLIGTAAVGFCPVFFVLSFTFMTDVPFLAFLVWSSFAAVRAVRMKSDFWLVTAALLAGIAIGIRFIAVAIPAALIATLWFHEEEWGRKPGRLLAGMFPLGVLIVLLLLRHTMTYPVCDLTLIKDSPVNRLSNLRLALPVLHRTLAWDVAFVGSALGLLLLPLAVGLFEKRNVVRALFIGGAVAACVGLAWEFGASESPMLSEGQTWAWNELGATESLIPGGCSADAYWWQWALTVLWIVSFAVLAASIRVGGNFGTEFLAWLALMVFLLMAVLWLFYDRYALGLMPMAVALALAGRSMPRPRLAIAAIGVFAVISFVGMRDHLCFNSAVCQAATTLRELGAKPGEIDAGYIFSGWSLYAHPDQALRDSRGEIIVPGVTCAKSDARYQISVKPISGYRVLRSFEYRRWAGRSGSVLVLERT